MTDIKYKNLINKTAVKFSSKKETAQHTYQKDTMINNSSRTIIITDQFPVISQTFIIDQIAGLIDRDLTIEHWSLQRMEQNVTHKNVNKYGLMDLTRYIELPPENLRLDYELWTKFFIKKNKTEALDNNTAIQIHFGPNFNKLAPLFRAYPKIFVLVSFHGYDGSATFKIKGQDVYKELFARANKITTPSIFMMNTLIQNGCPSDKIIVHHYGKDTTEFAPHLQQKKSGPVRILSVARFVEKKGLEYSIAAFAKAHTGTSAEYRIIGYGPLGPQLMKLAQSLGVAEKVKFLGQLTNEDVRKEMAEADIFALTSVTASNGDQEGVPVSLIEAQAFGLPVVSTKHAGIPELVTHGKTGFLSEERNIDEIASYLRALIKNKTIRDEFSTNARQKVLQEFDIEKLNNALAEHLTFTNTKNVTDKKTLA